MTRPTGSSPAEKIKSLDDLAALLAEAKRNGATVAQCHGTFELLHPGHIRHLTEAREQAQILVVTITADRFINKGPGRPVFNESLRAESLAALALVDHVAIVPYPSGVEAIAALKPDVYVKGSDYAHLDDDPTGKIHDELEAVRAAGGRIHFTDQITFSSSKLINTNFSPFPPETDAWLKNFRSGNGGGEAVVEWLDRLSDLKVLVVGETIIDEYVFSSVLGKAAKDPILAFLYDTTETYAGGSLAVANHAAGFTSSVSVVSLIGEFERREDFIRRSLKANVELHPVVQKGAPTLHKRRFVDSYTGTKMFELYVMEDGPLAEETEAALRETLEVELAKADVVVIPDYGHGMMTPAIVRLVAEKAKFLVVNTQANAGNRGFNMVSKYPRADYVCIAAHEMELETRMRNAGYRDQVRALSQSIDCPDFTVTIGKAGSIHHTRGGGFTEAPALATRVVDRVGAGDAVLAVTGMLKAIGAPWDIVSLVTNVVGAEMVGDLGNRVSIEKGRLSKNILSLLK